MATRCCWQPAHSRVNAAFDMPLPYDTYKDLTPVVHFFDVPILVAASNEAPFKSMAELVARAKSEPVSYASASGGSMQHLWAELIRMRLGLRLEHVGYKGSSEAVRDVMGGHLPLLVDLVVPTGAAVKSGKLRGLAVATSKRSALLPTFRPSARSASPDGKAPSSTASWRRPPRRPPPWPSSMGPSIRCSPRLTLHVGWARWA